MMKRFLRAAAVLILFAALRSVAHAQNGCVDSPENPTALLALAGMAGATAPALLRRLRRRG